MRHFALFTLSVAFLAAIPASADTNVSGSITTDTTWTAANSPYIATGWVTVNAGKTLTIEPGVTVKFDGNTGLAVNGRLLAVGTSTSAITLTSSAASPTPGAWSRIEVQTSDAASQVTYATISYSGGAGFAVRIFSGTMNFDHTTITQSGGMGIQSVTSSPITLSSVTISNCAGDGLNVSTNTGVLSGLHTITDSTFSANSGYGVNLGSNGYASVANSTFTNNTDYALGAQATSSFGPLSTLTATGNGSGTKDVIQYRGGTFGTHDETWRASTLPYIITADVTVPSGRILTIEPGFTGKFNTNTSLTIGGKLFAVGTAASLITLTSSAATPAPGGWSYLLVQTSDPPPTSQLSYATISDGGSAGYAVRVNAGVMNFDHVTVTQSAGTGIQSDTNSDIALNTITISNCAGDGLYVSTVSGVLGGLHTVTGSTFSTNTGHGVNLGGNGNASVANSTFTNNTDYAIGAQATSFFGALSGLTATGNGSGLKNAIAYRGGTLGTHDETWRASTLPYIFTGGTEVPDGRTLTVEPGFVGKFNPFTDLTIRGRLAAVGTSASPITFTTSAVTPSRGAWNGIQIIATPTNAASQISYATVAFAGNNGYALRVLAGSPSADHLTLTDSSGVGLLTITTGTLTLDTTTATNCTSHGMEIEDSSGTPGQSTTTNSTFTNNGGYGMYVGDRGRTTVTQSTFTGNTSGALRSTTTSVDARLCYWGDATGPSGSGYGTGQSITSLITFEPWLASTPTTAQQITSITIKNRTFNPNLPASTKVTAQTTATGSWTFNIINAANATIRTITGSGVIADVAWDGKNSSGVIQANGNYTYEVQSTSGTNTAAPARGRATIDTTKQLTFTAYAATPAFISPNGDGVQDTTTLAGTVNYDDVTWTLQVKNAGNAVVRTSTGTGIVSSSWDGRNDASTLQADGAYTATMSVTEGASMLTGNATVTIDTVAPVASITAPTNNTTLSNVYQNGSSTISVNGTITDANLSNWTLDQSITSNPSVWTVIGTGTSAVSAAQIAQWQTVALANGTYNLRLRAWDQAGNLTAATITPVLANFTMSQSAYQFNPGANQTLTYTSNLPFTLTEGVSIKNEAGAVVRTLVNAQRNAGSYNDVWNGRNDSTVLLPDGGYSYTANVTDGTHSMTWDTSSTFRGSSVLSVYPIINLNFDPFNNVPVRAIYTLTDAYRVALEVGAHGTYYGPDCAALHQDWGTICLTQWKYQASGTYNVSWWGTDNDGSFAVSNFGANPGLQVILRQDNFPTNSVVLYGTAPTITSERVTPALFNPGAAVPALNNPTAGTQSVTFTLGTFQSQPIALTMLAINQSSLSTLRTITVPSQAAGAVTVTWDGRSDNGVLLAPGTYTLIVTATDTIGNSTTQHLVTTIEY